LRVAQDYFVTGRALRESSHFVHGVDYEGFICHSRVILPVVLCCIIQAWHAHVL
jgi:hypothetical protein